MLIINGINSQMNLQVYKSVAENNGHVLRIPIVETHVRSLNLAVSNGIGLFEAIRQIDTPVQMLANKLL